MPIVGHAGDDVNDGYHPHAGRAHRAAATVTYVWSRA